MNREWEGSRGGSQHMVEHDSLIQYQRAKAERIQLVRVKVAA